MLQSTERTMLGDRPDTALPVAPMSVETKACTHDKHPHTHTCLRATMTKSGSFLSPPMFRCSTNAHNGSMTVLRTLPTHPHNVPDTVGPRMRATAAN